jgi:uncharacterized protein (TIGR03086 family)
MTTPGDLRHHLSQSQAWVASLIEGIGPDQWHAPTPCTEFDVTALVEHLFAVQERVRLLATVRSVDGAPSALPLPKGVVVRAFRAAADAGSRAWSDWTEEDLGARTVSHPIGTIPGSAAVALYADEHLTHGWDLAVATGQDAEAPAGLVEPVLAFMQAAMPAKRPPAVPFADAVESSPDAGPTERLANWMGRSR